MQIRLILKINLSPEILINRFFKYKVKTHFFEISQENRRDETKITIYNRF